MAWQLRKRIQEWGVQLLSEKQAAFFTSTQEQEHCVSWMKLPSMDQKITSKVASVDTEVASMKENIN